MSAEIGRGTPTAGGPRPSESVVEERFGWRQRLISQVVEGGVVGRIGAIAIALVMAAPVFMITGADPGSSYSGLFDGSFGSPTAVGDVLSRADTLVLLALGIAICLRAGFFNVGAEGQLWMGALGATVASTQLGLPGTAGIIVALVTGIAAGAMWSGLVAVLKIYAKVDELIGSLMLNYIAILFVGYLTFGPMKDYRAGQSERIPQDLYLPTMFGTRLHVGFLLAVTAAVVLWLVLRRTSLGYELRTLGGSVSAARFGGIDENRVVIKVALIGGGLCGLAGANAILGVQHVLLSTFSPGYGYTAIAVALLGGLRPLGILAAGVLFGALEIGSSNMQYVAGVPASMGGLIEGMILVLFLIGMTLPRPVRTQIERLAYRFDHSAEKGS